MRFVVFKFDKITSKNVNEGEYGQSVYQEFEALWKCYSLRPIISIFGKFYFKGWVILLSNKISSEKFFNSMLDTPFFMLFFIRIYCQKLENILRIIARLKYLIKNLESPILILHQELAFFTMECLLFTMEFTMKYFCVFLYFPFLPRVVRLVFRGIFYSIYYATWENL